MVWSALLQRRPYWYNTKGQICSRHHLSLKVYRVS